MLSQEKHIEYWKKHSSVHRTLQPQKDGDLTSSTGRFYPLHNPPLPQTSDLWHLLLWILWKDTSSSKTYNLAWYVHYTANAFLKLAQLPMSSVTSRDLMVLLIVKKKLPGPLLHGLIWYLSISLQMKDRTRSEQPHKQKSAEFLCVLSVLLTAVSPSQFMRRCVNDTHTPKPSIQFLLNAQWSKFSTNKYILHWRWTVFALHLCLT